MQHESNISHGVKWGIIIGVVYCFLLWLRYSTGASNLMILGTWTFVGYAIVLALLLVSGFLLRKKLGGYVELKEVFKILFLSVLIYEFFYTIFNFIYMKYIDPAFFDRLRAATEELL